MRFSLKPFAFAFVLLLVLSACTQLTDDSPTIISTQATITVTNLDNDGVGSLRWAIAEAEPDDTISFDVTGTITLLSELVIDKDLIIQGPDVVDGIILSGNGTNRIFSVLAGFTVNLYNLTITGGSGLDGGAIYNNPGSILNIANSIIRNNSADDGGGIYNLGSLSIIDSIIGNNSADNGGGIYNLGSLSVANSLIFDNSADIGGGIYNDSDGTLRVIGSDVDANSAAMDGGGIYNNGVLTVTNSGIAENSAIWDGGGIYNNGTLDISNSDVFLNFAALDGGGIFNDGTIDISNGNVNSNGASMNGGGIFNSNGTFNISNTDVFANGAAIDGGGIHIALGSVSVGNSTIDFNNADRGGGIYHNDGILTIADSALLNNNAEATDGGGLYVYTGEVNVIRSTVAFNTASAEGGGIFNEEGEVNLTNTTVAGNSAVVGGGIANFDNVTILNSTIAFNTAALVGGGIADFDDLYLTNSIVALNTSPNGPDIYGAVSSASHNLLSSLIGTTGITDSVNGNIVTADPDLDPAGLQDNGGPTPTIALLPDSPAINAADDASCPETDQRGVERPQGAACDMGAFELVLVADLSLTKTVSSSEALAGEPLTYTLTVTNFGPRPATNVTITDDLDPIFASFIVNEADYSLSYDPGVPILPSLTIVGNEVSFTLVEPALAANESLTLTIVATPQQAGTFTNTATVTADEVDPDLSNNTDSATVTVLLNIITDADLGTIRLHRAYELQLEAFGGVAPYSWTSPDLQTAVRGLSLTADGRIIGRPLQRYAEPRTFTVYVTDTNGAVGEQEFTVVVR